jgi:sec-independent protein translocase protein TatC
MEAEREKNMHFLDHLEELRWRIVKSLLGIVAGGAVTFAFIDPVLDVLIAPIKSMDAPWELQVLKVQGMFLIKWSIAFIGGIVLGLPVITYQFWQFVTPALRGKERNVAFPLILFTYLSFLIGIFFAYKILIPVSLSFFASMGVSDIQNQFSINYYFSFITWLMIGCGLVFELPVLVYFLAKIGLATPAFMRHYRRHAIVLIMVISAFVTPPDPVSLFMMTLPLAVLYEISIGVAWFVTKGK